MPPPVEYVILGSNPQDELIVVALTVAFAAIEFVCGVS